jgi:hypothetical protein
MILPPIQAPSNPTIISINIPSPIIVPRKARQIPESNALAISHDTSLEDIVVREFAYSKISSMVLQEKEEAEE